MNYHYLLHYIGKGLYPNKDFIEESKRLGVNRAFPITLVKSLRWGSTILLANWSNTYKGKHPSKAVVFGYYEVRGINFDTSDDVKAALYSKLKITKSIGVNQNIERKCGSYNISTVNYVEDSVEEIMSHLMDILKDTPGAKAKVFIAGPFHLLRNPIEISPINFTRSGIFINLNRRVRNYTIKDGYVSFIGDYEKREYRLKKTFVNHSIYDWEVLQFQ